MILDLNEADLASDRHGYFMGSWCEADGDAVFVSLLPNSLARPGRLTGLVGDMVSRVQWFTEEILDYDMAEHYGEATPAMYRIMERMDDE